MRYLSGENQWLLGLAIITAGLGWIHPGLAVVGVGTLIAIHALLCRD